MTTEKQLSQVAMACICTLGVAIAVCAVSGVVYAYAWIAAKAIQHAGGICI